MKPGFNLHYYIKEQKGREEARERSMSITGVIQLKFECMIREKGFVETCLSGSHFVCSLFLRLGLTLVAQAGLKLMMKHRLVLTLWHFCLIFSNARITGMSRHE